ncbi:hypothetical protein TeGR_g7578 [Tetraparma gracilis]|uniref:Uncharacterized protein n=1 Tax=Tetraparma gracilis TaxID=2962635 RepID=A0ABQ6MWI9_9STRA|nr:hypothetical protein TeGR_g7578 [Tetraparma gracilis]
MLLRAGLHPRAPAANAQHLPALSSAAALLRASRAPPLPAAASFLRLCSRLDAAGAAELRAQHADVLRELLERLPEQLGEAPLGAVGALAKYARLALSLQEAERGPSLEFARFLDAMELAGARCVGALGEGGEPNSLSELDALARLLERHGRPAPGLYEAAGEKASLLCDLFRSGYPPGELHYFAASPLASLVPALARLLPPAPPGAAALSSFHARLAEVPARDAAGALEAYAVAARLFPGGRAPLIAAAVALNRLRFLRTRAKHGERAKIGDEVRKDERYGALAGSIALGIGEGGAYPWEITVCLLSLAGLREARPAVLGPVLDAVRDRAGFIAGEGELKDVQEAAKFVAYALRVLKRGPGHELFGEIGRVAGELLDRELEPGGGGGDGGGRRRFTNVCELAHATRDVPGGVPALLEAVEARAGEVVGGVANPATAAKLAAAFAAARFDAPGVFGELDRRFPALAGGWGERSVRRATVSLARSFARQDLPPVNFLEFVDGRAGAIVGDLGASEVAILLNNQVAHEWQSVPVARAILSQQERLLLENTPPWTLVRIATCLGDSAASLDAAGKAAFLAELRARAKPLIAALDFAQVSQLLVAVAQLGEGSAGEGAEGLFAHGARRATALLDGDASTRNLTRSNPRLLVSTLDEVWNEHRKFRGEDGQSRQTTYFALSKAIMRWRKRRTAEIGGGKRGAGGRRGRFFRKDPQAKRREVD